MNTTFTIPFFGINLNPAVILATFITKFLEGMALAAGAIVTLRAIFW
jgi:hypothetical protein